MLHKLNDIFPVRYTVFGLCVLALLLNLIPYLGSIVVTGASALAGFVQFGSVDMGLVLGGTSIALHTVSGHLLTPWLTSRASRSSST